MWSKVIYNPGSQFIQERSPEVVKYRELFTYRIAEGLYKDVQQIIHNVSFSEIPVKEFRELTKTEKSFWNAYAEGIPDKFQALNLFVRPFESFCRTCIITDNEIDSLIRIDHNRYYGKMSSKDLKSAGIINVRSIDQQDERSFLRLAREWNRFFTELNYLIPLQLKKIGYEILRYEEVAGIDALLIKKIARSIHARYLHEIRNQNHHANSHLISDAGDLRNQYSSDFDNLPDEIRFSNFDNAAHIPTKLLSIGYKIRKARKGFKPYVLHLNGEEIETMSRVEHLRWSWEKRLNGWVFGSIKDDLKKTHPGLIPYEDLSKLEKEKDRKLVMLIPALLQDIDYEAYPVNPSHLKKLSYAIKPQGSIHRILNETRELNSQIRKLVTLSPELEEMVRKRNSMIEEAIIEVEGSYNYAQHIQETYLPDDHYIRECFPESFILFKPKDIVSGDFYFFSKQGDLNIFAAADCTGHGIPGALLSTLGYGIIDQAVNEIKLTDPSEILHHLYSKVHRFLRRDTEVSGISDDLDIILCILDISTNILSYSGVKNSLYHFSNGCLIEHHANNIIDDCNEDGKCKFISEKITLESGDSIYISSDGFADQFGGKSHKKYQTGRFKCFLETIVEYSMPEQCEKLFEEIELWREENREDQTDDILVIGIRI